MEKIFVSIRDLDKEIYMRLKMRALMEKKKIGELIAISVKRYLQETQKEALEKNLEKARKALDIKPVDLGSGNDHLSEQIDEILYGEKE